VMGRSENHAVVRWVQKSSTECFYKNGARAEIYKSVGLQP
jgi:hypothetical protein